MTNAAPSPRKPKPQHAPGARLVQRSTDAPARAPGKPHPAARAPRITRRVSKAITDMIWLGLTPNDAADRHKINHGAFARILNLPAIQQIIKREMDVLMQSTAPRALKIISVLMEDGKVERVRLDAAKYIHGEERKGGPGVQVNVGIAANITPGYVIAIPQDYVEPARQMLKLAGSTANALENQGDVAHSEKATP